MNSIVTISFKKLHMFYEFTLLQRLRLLRSLGKQWIDPHYKGHYMTKETSSSGTMKV